VTQLLKLGLARRPGTVLGMSIDQDSPEASRPTLGRLPRGLNTAQLLTLIGRIGALAPEQLAALIGRCLPAELTADDIVRVDAAIKTLERHGLILVTRARATLRVLRTAARRVYRPAGALTDWASADERKESWRVGAALGQPKAHEAASWIEEAQVHALAFPRTNDRAYVRHRLKKLVQAGLFESRSLRDPQFVRVVTLTPAGRRRAMSDDARQGHTISTLSDAPREDEIIHHLLLMEAVLRILCRENGELESLRGDAALRRRNRRGRRTRLGDLLDPVPDAELVYFVDQPDSGAGLRCQVIEVLVSKYSDRELRAKYRAKWAEAAMFVAPTAALCDRVERLVGRRPELLEPRAVSDRHAAAQATVERVVHVGPTSPSAVLKHKPVPTERQRHYHARSRTGRYDAAIIAQVASYGVLLIRQIVEHLHRPGERVSRSSRYRTVRRLIRRGLLRSDCLPGSTGHGVLHFVSITEIGRELLSAAPAANAARKTSWVLASTVRRDHCLQFAEVVLKRITEGWHYVPRKDVGELFHSEARHRASFWERRDISLLMHQPPTIGLTALHNPATHEVRLLLPIDDTRRYVRQLADLSKLRLYRTLDLELVCTSPGLEGRARRRIERWAEREKMTVQCHCASHCTIPARNRNRIQVGTG